MSERTETPVVESNVSSLNGSPKTSNYDLGNDDEVDPTLMEKIKGDAIGNTLYSQRFVLTTLMKLPNLDRPISDDEDYEKDLCIVWDQTVERDVVKFLLEYKVLEIFAACINEDDGRLTEILVGIIANMCALTETRQQLEAAPEITITLISLIASTDPLVLVQVMRFFHAVLVFENAGDELIWFQYFDAIDNFVDKFAFVLASSTSSTLLRHSLEALNAICAKFAVIEIRPEGGKSNFVDMFVTPTLVAGLIEAFNQVVGNSDEEVMAAPEENTAKFISLFLDVGVILTQYDLVSKQAFADKIEDFLDCLGRVLVPLCQPVYLFPLSTATQGIVENLSDVLQALDYPFDAKYWSRLIKIYTLIYEESNRKKSNGKNGWEDSDDDDDDNDGEVENKVDDEDIRQTLLEIIGRSGSKIEDLTPTCSVMDHKQLKDFLNAVQNVEDIETCKEIGTVLSKLKEFHKNSNKSR